LGVFGLGAFGLRAGFGAEAGERAIPGIMGEMIPEGEIE